MTELSISNSLKLRLHQKDLCFTVFYTIPDGVTILEPPNAIFSRRESLIKSNVVDDTLDRRDQILRRFIPIAVAIFLLVCVVFVMTSEPRKRKSHFGRSEHTDQIRPKTTITETMILETSSLDPTMQTQDPLFHRNSVKVGDKVSPSKSLSDAEMNDDLNEQERNFNTPLRIVANENKIKGFSSSSFDKLAVAPNTMAHVYLEHDLMNENISLPISAVSYTEVVNQGKVIIPKGSRLIGSAHKIVGKRILIRFESIIMPDGREFSIEASALGSDNVVGITGRVDQHYARKSGNLFASALLDTTARSLNFSSNSFGHLFAGNMADKTADTLDDGLDQQMRQTGMSIKISANMRFKVVFSE